MKIPNKFVENFNIKEKGKSIIGQQLEYIFVEKVAGFIPDKRNNKISKVTIYQCKCNCGKTFLVRAKDVKNGKTKSCGCLRKENAKLLGVSNKKKKGEAGVKILYSRYHNKSIDRGYEFHITYEEFTKLINGNCFYCGKAPYKLLSKTYINSENAQLFYNGLDRKDNTKGYLLENVVSCCSVCNYAKHKLNYNLFIEHIEHLYHNLKSKGLLTSQTLEKEKEENNKTND